MYPILFKIGNLAVETYYVLWFSALTVALLWTVRRLPLYGVDDNEGRRVISWTFIGMLVGARAFEYIWNFPVYWNDPALILDLNRGGLAEVGALSGALITTLCLCWRNSRVSFERLADAAVPAVFLSMALGRWGCLAAGCCTGIQSTLPFALHFPYDASGVTRHPTQIYHALSAAAILVILLLVEKKIMKHKRIPIHAVITPLGGILYVIMRLAVSPFRTETQGMMFSHKVAIGLLLISTLWFTFSLWGFHKNKTTS